MNKENIPESRDREKQFKDKLKEKGVFFVECQSSLLYDPTILSLKPGFNGGHWGTLMPFFKGCKKQLGEPRRPLPRYQTVSMLEAMKGPDSWPKSIPVSNLAMGRMRRENAWDMPIKERFPMSEDDALKNLDTFFKNGFHRYEKERSRADIEWSTSKLSVHLRIGTLSPNELFYRVEDSDMDYEDKKTFSRRLFWRDLAYFQLLKFPGMRDCSIRTHYDDTEWVDGKEEKRRFEAWKKGNTGYPLVDAGMRELYETGWMTQSVRMIVASFLTEYLRVNWVKGCEWFHYTLVDADSAINAMMWQNAGRSGIDQWNFIMSPVAATQDATGSFTRRWVPELALLPKSFLHKPWDAPDEVLKQAGITLGETYPLRIVVDLKAENEISDNNVLAMRRRHPEFNNDRGYDTISVDGCNTVVFTKKKFRIDEEGNVVTKNSTNLFKPGNDGSKRRYRGRSRKLPA
jgi:deoxyribodipyrimidine photolyase